MIRRFQLSDFRVMTVLPLEAQLTELFTNLESQLDIPAIPVSTREPRREYNNKSGSGPRENGFTPSNAGGGHGRGRNFASASSVSIGKTKKQKDAIDHEPALEDWEAIRNFKATKMEVKVGIDKVVSELRTLINKLTNANYEQHHIRIIQTVRDYYAMPDMVSEENTAKLINSMVDIMCSNKMYTDIYAELYREILDEFDDFRAPMMTMINGMIAQEPVLYVDPDLNYDEYCKYNKHMDRRKNATTFAISCVKHDMIECSELLRLMHWYLSEITRIASDADNDKVVEEYAELIFILVSRGSTMMLECVDEWNSACSIIAEYSAKKAKTMPSLSNRAVFKFKDINDILNK